MSRSLKDIKNLYEKPKNTQAIKQAIDHEDRIRFHVERFLRHGQSHRAMSEFLDWVQGLLPRDKFDIFRSLFRLPTPAVSVTNTAFKDLKRVVQGRNPQFHYEFKEKSFLADWLDYRETQLNEPTVWETEGWEQVRTSINSVLVVDIPSEQVSKYPEPYFYWMDIRSIHDYSLRNKTEFEHVMFKQSDDTLIVIDTEAYYSVRINPKTNELTSIASKNEHGLGYCPAKFFWTEATAKESPGVKNSPITSQLADLDWFVFYKTSKKHLDMYASYPIYWTFEGDCNYKNQNEGSYCDGGYLRHEEDDSYLVGADMGLVRCPVCRNAPLAGAGTVIEAPIPDTKEDADLREPAGVIHTDYQSLKYNAEEVERLEEHIYKSIVGVGGQVTERQSINTKQVTANFESRVSVLNDLKINLEAAMKFVDDTVCRLRYGDYFTESSISLGTEFYVYSVDDLYLKYEQAKKNGASEAELDAINEQILSAEYKNDPAQLQRMIVLRHLEPYRHYTLAELSTLNSMGGVIDPVMLKIKVNFNDYVQRFERENTNVIEFGSRQNLSDKVDTILTKFKDYVREQTETTSEPISTES